MSNANLEFTVSGCKYIGESISKCVLFGSYASQLISNGGTATFGVQPTMPSLSVKPIQCVCNSNAILPHVKDLGLTWMCVQNTNRYGVYHTVIALFGDRHWVTRLSNGQMDLRVFDKPF